MKLLTSNSCEPCKLLKRNFPDLPTVSIDSPEGTKLAGSFNIRSVPVLFHNDEPVAAGAIEIIRYMKGRK